MSAVGLTLLLFAQAAAQARPTGVGAGVGGHHGLADEIDLVGLRRGRRDGRPGVIRTGGFIRA